MVDEPSVEVSESGESADLFDILWCRPFEYSFDLDGIHGDLVMGNNSSKEFDFWNLELTFLEFEKEVIVPESLEYSFSPLLMFFEVGRVD